MSGFVTQIIGPVIDVEFPEGKLPKISISDPIVRYYGMKTNQICKIIRKSPEVGNYIYYRLVR